MKAAYTTLAALAVTLTLGVIAQDVSADVVFDLRPGKAANGQSVTGRTKFSLISNGITATFIARNGVFVRNGVHRAALAGVGIKSAGKDSRPYRINARKNGREVIVVRFSEPIKLDLVQMLSFKGTNLARAGLSFTGALAGPTSLPATSDKMDLSAYGATTQLRMVFNSRGNGVRLVTLSSIESPNGGGDDGGGDNGGGGDGEPTVVPLPSAAWVGVAFLGVLGLIHVARRRRLAA